MNTLAIIGTAGRGDDFGKLTLRHWAAMVTKGREVVKLAKAGRLVSGGAAWADHVAIELHRIDGLPLRLHLPGLASDQATAAKYHLRFEYATGIESAQMVDLVCQFSCDYVRKGSFKERNSRVAEDATHWLAMTFGDGPKLKDGGTADTVRKMQAMGKPGWHFDLNSFRLFQIAI